MLSPYCMTTKAGIRQRASRRSKADGSVATKSPAFDEFHGLVHSSCEGRGKNANSTRLDLRVGFRNRELDRPISALCSGHVARLDPMVSSFSRLSLVAPIEDTRVQVHAEILVARPSTYFSPGLQKSTVAFWRPPFSQHFRRIKPPALRQTLRRFIPVDLCSLSADLPQSFSLS